MRKETEGKGAFYLYSSSALLSLSLSSRSVPRFWFGLFISSDSLCGASLPLPLRGGGLHRQSEYFPLRGRTFAHNTLSFTIYKNMTRVVEQGAKRKIANTLF